MKNIKFISPLILSLGYLLIFAQSLKGQFKPAARVILSDNTVIELSNFEIHSYHSRPTFYYQRSSSKKMKIPLKQGNFWRELSFKEIDKISLSKNKKSYRWLDAKIYLRSGQLLIGEIPATPGLMWKSGSAININGTVKILGRKGDLKISILKVKEIKRDEKNSGVYYLTTEENTTKVLSNPYLTCYWYGSDANFTTWRLKSNSMLKFQTEGIKVQLKMRDIDSLSFSPENKVVFVKMKDGNLATGKFVSGISKIKGYTKAGLIFYKSLTDKKGKYDIKSIKFL